MAYDIKNTKVIYLGRQGENLARTIEIDVSSMLMKWPDATISLLVQRNQEDTFYLAPVVIENGILKWTITNADTEIAGIGKIEVRAIQDDAIMKSATMKICVENSLGGTETVVPDPVQTWVDTIVAASVQAKQSAEDALASELAAKKAAESITGLESNIKTAEAARVEAEKERISAENERESAETSRETAENNRVAAETARVTAEQNRASAETARESAETNRQTTFETNEAQRQTAFETAEAGRAAAESSRVAAEESRVSAEAGRVEAESERVTAENQRAETFAGYETRIDAATPDDSTVDGKPWTSRKIVDTLCPPFDVSGSAVTCHPVASYPLGVVSRIDAVQQGSGDPSPENVRPINGWDAVNLNQSNDGGKEKIYTAALPETIYGGELDWNTGVLTVNNKLLTFNGTENFEAYSYTNGFFLIIPDVKKILENKYVSNFNCSHFTAKAFYKNGYFQDASDAFAQEAGGTRNIAFRKSGVEKGDIISFKNWLAAQYAAGTPVQLRYELETPYTIQLTPQQIIALSGVNTLYTDSGDTSVSGRTDMIWLTQSLIDRIAALETAAVSE